MIGQTTKQEQKAWEYIQITITLEYIYYYYYITTSNILQLIQQMYNAVKSNLVSTQNLGFDLQPRSRCSACTSASRIRNKSKFT